MTSTSLFDYHLPEERIAQQSVEPRDHSRLLVLDRKTGTWQHQHFYDVGQFLKAGDLLVVNETKVFKARLQASVQLTANSLPLTAPSGRKLTADSRKPSPIEIFLLRPDGDRWRALAKPGKKLSIGTVVTFTDERTATVTSKHNDGTVMFDFKASPEEVLSWADAVGDIPIPPYVSTLPASTEQYQTVYAKHVGSVAAPTAGFHFTPELIERLITQGIRFTKVTLHVGLGTFRPIKSDTIEAHEMHEEWIDVPEETQKLIAETKQNGGRVIAVGTTTVRALESNVTHGFTNIFITPGYKFKTIDGLITNFHLPKSSLIVLVSSFVGEKQNDPDMGREIVLKAYQDAITNNYRFYSFGDAMLID